jgi:hypothetical protein
MTGAASANKSWDRYKKYLCRVDSVGLTLDVSKMEFDDAYLASMKPAIDKDPAATKYARNA